MENNEPVIDYCEFINNAGSLVLKITKGFTITNSLFSKTRANTRGFLNTEKLGDNSECNFENVTFEFASDFTALDISKGKFNFIDCKFNNNSAEQQRPGAIYAHGESIIKLIKCNFTGNTGDFHGGAISVEIKSIELDECSFIENKCNNQNPSSDANARGGAIYFIAYSEFKLDYCTFERNSAKSSGGAVHIEYHESSSKLLAFEKVFYVTNCTFADCETKGEGGAITSGFIDKKGTKLDGDMEIENCKFINCRAENGGALYFQDGTESGDEEKRIKNCLFVNCLSTHKDGEGCAIYAQSFEFTMTFNNFTSHQGTGYSTPSIVFIDMNEKTPTIEDCIFDDNKYVSSLSINTKSSLTISRCTFSNHENYGYIINLNYWNVEGSATLQNCSFNDNKNGRCIVMDKNNLEAIVDGCHFINNTIIKQMRELGAGSCI